eukprot:CAMPEP_0168354684 /NCGR_PEP_ID=MMETSP0213-20121227/24055_1 /TAXON_ID=151035 /ORGANISM="Euplotes harpa, Strain FSP1.4" /LENGTH=69 /DNA_ID=CAMNT_0008366657 /DNA_START=1 /DNA_END=210 /DNA_ORIENTATION=-
MKEKQDKAMAELEEFFNRNPSSDGSSTDDENNEFISIIEQKRTQFPVLSKEGNRKRFGELEPLKANSFK